MTARESAERKWWTDLETADWLFDGRPIKIGWMDAWRKLDWSKAWLDMGPSPAGNIGPYFHVPDDDDDCVHRLYPKLLRKPNLQAMVEGIMSVATARARAKATAEERERCAKVAETTPIALRAGATALARETIASAIRGGEDLP